MFFSFKAKLAEESDSDDELFTKRTKTKEQEARFLIRAQTYRELV